MSQPGGWEKVLWKKQPYSDNHVPVGLFLTSLKKNSNFEPYTYWPLVILSCAITQHVATIFTFVAVFIRLQNELLDPLSLVWISIVCFLAGYTTWNFLACKKPVQSDYYANHLKALKSSILMFLALMSLSPVLRTLTAATSSDSIWALAAGLFVLNALLADYGPLRRDGQVHERLTSVLSMNAAVSASVVLASRLSTDVSVFALILFSIQAFALFPMLRQRLQTAATAIWLLLTFCLSTLAVVLIAPLSDLVMRLYLLTLLFVTFFAPAILVWAQRYKNNIRGPWDVAVPKVK